MSQVPQCAAFEATHWPPHASKPPLQTHCPPAHICPIAQGWPHAPQFCESVATLVHELAHIIWPALQVTPTPPVPDGTVPTWPVHASAPTSAMAGTRRSRQLFRNP